MKILILVSVTLVLGACTSMQLERHPLSGYTNYEDSVYREVSLRDLQARAPASLPPQSAPTTAHPSQIGEESSRFAPSVSKLVEQNDIALGMKKEAVRESWGEPDYVEVSGNPKFENERWRFSVPIKTSAGYHFEERFVYFERGHVIGWNTR